MLVPYFWPLFKFYYYWGLIYSISFASMSQTMLCLTLIWANHIIFGR
jgi:hypothetical protein